MVIIRKIKLLPAQRHIFVVREVKYDASRRSFLYQLFTIPPPGSTVKNAIPLGVVGEHTLLAIEEEDISSVDFFEITDSYYQDCAAGHDGSNLSLTGQNLNPPDLCVWAVSSGLVHEKDEPIVFCHHLRAQPRSLPQEDPAVSFWYEPSSSRTQYRQYRPLAIAGGAKRAVWLLPPSTDLAESSNSITRQVGSIIRYTPGEMSHDHTTTDSVSEASELTQAGELMPFRLPSPVVHSLRRGLTAYAFDEATGRLIIASENSCIIHVLDCSGYV
jgi:hypothetical protein